MKTSYTELYAKIKLYQMEKRQKRRKAFWRIFGLILLSIFIAVFAFGGPFVLGLALWYGYATEFVCQVRLVSIIISCSLMFILYVWIIALVLMCNNDTEAD